ncbi:hypothetical protein EcE24377A_3159 [Escherichia coli O139:H28 str. E24377A]|uniref:Uncharacterized protein n=1 Tax=Escherichia coli O139:H28 (strain E24377A / ETEC) TaxID=331111 RepID=A7ZQU6_ECO24|nr:hypothetical protein EcE24377A_3159 [Escherichia coli O139:H28 str. E24377A]
MSGLTTETPTPARTIAQTDAALWVSTIMRRLT